MTHPPASPSSVSLDLVRRLQAKSILYRKTILDMIYTAGAGHTGGSLSCVDILNVLYNHVMNIRPQNFAQVERDHYVHSKGHSVEALYAVLTDLGFFPLSALDSLEKYDSAFIGHPTRAVPGIEHNTGALGHGLSFAVGLALAARLDNLDGQGPGRGGQGPGRGGQEPCRPYRVFTLLGDGELAEGSNWEASASAAHYRLDNLVVIIDRNTLQISGRTEQVMALEPLVDKFRAFGYAVREVDGNDLAALVALFTQLPFETGKPNLVLAHTVKGKGISFIEDRTEWHHHVPSEAEYAAALQELARAAQELEASHA